MNPIPSTELLEMTHSFPGTYQVRAIGAAADDFAGRVLAVVAEVLDGPEAVSHSLRTTAGGRHVALTLDLQVGTADQVRTVYERILAVEGLTLLF